MSYNTLCIMTLAGSGVLQQVVYNATGWFTGTTASSVYIMTLAGSGVLQQVVYSATGWFTCATTRSV